ncbi:hypothetical protein ACLSC2_000786 [Enterococcus faecium]|uniref:hypothetical protein n=1 Tax=Enterococcus TaxID=1350 RepID=UPI0019F9BE3B|nr:MULTISPECIES: hypothetical protein [Enterococcus]EGP4758755.1 hypothetical protein [Enterococcus faecium]EGP5416322.1 hypothetical protein [Enterococcus faecium]EMF0343202.1 hypothetical protein [Enterococcus faecium]MEB4605518.1 hypothetical protein [Enterococcus sp. E4-185]UQQ78731.1 hypothetical protein LQ060_05125 [Enterococcus faecium]
MITRIDIGLSLLNKRFKQVDKRIKAKVVFHDGSVDIWLFYKTLFFSRKIGAIHSSGFEFVNPKIIGLRNKDMEFIYQIVRDFQREYL